MVRALTWHARHVQHCAAMRLEALEREAHGVGGVDDAAKLHLVRVEER